MRKLHKVIEGERDKENKPATRLQAQVMALQHSCVNARDAKGARRAARLLKDACEKLALYC